MKILECSVQVYKNYKTCIHVPKGATAIIINIEGRKYISTVIERIQFSVRNHLFVDLSGTLARKIQGGLPFISLNRNVLKMTLGHENEEYRLVFLITKKEAVINYHFLFEDLEKKIMREEKDERGFFARMLKRRKKINAAT